MPVRSLIHASSVSTSFSKSALVITRGGTYPLTPVIFAARRLGILSPCGLLLPGKKKRDFTQSKPAKQAWSGAGFSLRGVTYAGLAEVKRRQAKACPTGSNGRLRVPGQGKD